MRQATERWLPAGNTPVPFIADPEHVPRNPSLSNLLYDTGFIERYGHDIRMIRQETEQHSLCTVEFTATADRFVVVFRKTGSEVLDEIDKSILARLHKLEQMGLVKKTGEGPGTRYVARM